MNKTGDYQADEIMSSLLCLQKAVIMFRNQISDIKTKKKEIQEAQLEVIDTDSSI